MTEPRVQNSSSWNATLGSLDFFSCVRQHAEICVWIWCCCVCFSLGIPASLVVLGELFRRHRQGTCNDFFKINLYFTDLTFALMLLLAIANIMYFQNLALFSFTSFIHCLPVCGRPLLMACICGDCYVAVVHPIIYKTSKNASMIRRFVTLMVWLVVGCFGALMCTVQSLYTSSLISVPLAMALPVIMFCDISILHALRKPDPSGNNNIHPQKRQALDTIFTSIVMTFIVYLPPVIIFFFAEILPISEEVFFCNFYFVGICFYDVGCVTMPLLYLYTIGKKHYHKSHLRKNVGK